MDKRKIDNYIYPLSEWEIIEEEFLPENNLRNETIFSLGNGYIGFRGNFEEGLNSDKKLSTEGTYINGFYESEVIKYPEPAYGYAERSQTMLNVTNSKLIKLFVDDEEFNMASESISNYKRVLSLKEGILRRSLLWKSSHGKEVSIDIKRFVSLDNKYTAAICYEITPINFCGKIKLISAIDGDVKNITVDIDPRVGTGLNGQAMDIYEKTSEGNISSIVQKTKNSNLSLACSIYNEISTSCNYDVNNINYHQIAGNEYVFEAVKGVKITLIKYIIYISSGDCIEEDLLAESSERCLQASKMGFASLQEKQIKFLKDFWWRTDVVIKGDPALQQGIRANMFHLLQSVGKDGLTNIGAKGLTGEGYEGHYFWDTETYILPFFLYNNSEISRSLLEYRYKILDKARERARQLSHQKGALYPWRTINGEECSAYYPAGTAQYHINADIAFAIKKYMDATEDYEFLIRYGAEILFETSRLWYDLGFFNPNKGNHFCINGVTGPDEYNAIVDNNCYTNIMAKENMLYACEIAEWMKKYATQQYEELTKKINLSDYEFIEWEKAANSMFIPYDEDLEIFLQDDGFLDRIQWNFEKTPKEKYPLLLHFHPLVIYRHRVCKQADLILAMFLLGNRFTKEEKRKNFDYYEKVTTHDSSLSTAIFSIIASEVEYYKKSYEYFSHTARMDLDDYNSNTKDGIHAANMAGTWMCVVNGFAGMRAYNGILSFNPYLPENWEEYSFVITYRRRLIRITVNTEEVRYELLQGNNLTIKHMGQEKYLTKMN